MPITSVNCDILGPRYLHDIHVHSPTKKSSFTLHQFQASPFSITSCHHCSGASAIGMQRMG
jgi:hypothetical protein